MLSADRTRESGEIFAQLTNGGESMSLDVQVVNPLIALIAGILILLMPRLLNYVVAIYLIVIGVLGLRTISICRLRKASCCSR
jgi:Protein of unknown function (DUF3096)